jgi:hypothetical protein
MSESSEFSGSSQMRNYQSFWYWSELSRCFCFFSDTGSIRLCFSFFSDTSRIRRRFSFYLIDCTDINPPVSSNPPENPYMINRSYYIVSKLIYKHYAHTLLDWMGGLQLENRNNLDCHFISALLSMSRWRSRNEAEKKIFHNFKRIVINTI